MIGNIVGFILGVIVGFWIKKRRQDNKDLRMARMMHAKYEDYRYKGDYE